MDQTPPRTSSADIEDERQLSNAMVVRKLVYNLVHPLSNALARNHWLIHRLFDIRIPKQTIVHFDPTTLLLRHALLRTVEPDDRQALEIGSRPRRFVVAESGQVDCSAGGRCRLFTGTSCQFAGRGGSQSTPCTILRERSFYRHSSRDSVTI